MTWWGWIIAFVIALIIFIRTRKRGYLMKDREGKKVKTKEFFKRWGQGIEGITPLQQSKTSMMGTWIVITGILAGLIINLLVRIKPHWVWIEVILLGSLIISVVQMIGTYQKFRKFKITDKVMKELNAPSKKKERGISEK